MEKENNVVENDGIVEPHTDEVVETNVAELEPKPKIEATPKQPKDLEFTIPIITIPDIKVDIPDFNAFPS